MKTITIEGRFNTTTYEVVEKMPKGFTVWAIGTENMGTDEYIPVCEMLNPKDKSDYSINMNTLKAIKVIPEQQSLLFEGAIQGVCDVKSAKRTINRVAKSYRQIRKKEIAEQIIDILERISE